LTTGAGRGSMFWLISGMSTHEFSDVWNPSLPYLGLKPRLT
jgi:hypothetical protein